jgi:murein DD-endopeptidase MepM/ murein hydrolase activator NlpD
LVLPVVPGWTLLALVAVAPAAHADPRARERALRAELERATRELQDTEARLAEAEDRLVSRQAQTIVDTWGAARSGGRSHQGTDVMAPFGAQVYAYTAGVVSRESTSASGGLQLYLQGDNGVEYFYAHLSRYAVRAGTRVRAGQLVASNGQSGNARYTAPHVHFEVHPGGPGSAPVNPYPYVRRACG